MGPKKYWDIETEEEIESTPLARGGAGVAWGLVFGGFGAVLCLLLMGIIWGWEGGVFWGVGGGLAVGLVGTLLEGAGDELEKVRGDPLGRGVHDRIARWQHSHRQRKLQQQTFPHVPDGALSRARGGSEPQETQASLSQAILPAKDPRRLTVGIATEAEKQEALPRGGRGV